MSDSHACQLRKHKSQAGFIKIRPNATILERVRLRINYMLMLDMKNWNCLTYFTTQSMMRFEMKRHLSGSCFIIHPFSKFNTVFECLTFIIWVFRYAIFMVGWHETFDIINPLLQALQVVFILCHFLLSYVDYDRKEIVIAPKKIAWHYIRTYFFVDFIVIFFDKTRVDEVNDVYNKFKVVAYVIAILARFPHNHKRLRDLLLHFKVNKAIIFLICHIFVTAFTLHFLTMMIILVPTFLYQNRQTANGWINNCAGAESVTKDTFGKVYSHGFLIIMCNFFGIGHDYDTRMPEECLMLTLVCIFGRLYTLVLLSHVLEIFGYPDLSQSQYERLLIEFREYSTSKNLPKMLYEKLRRLAEYKFQKSYFNEKEILSTLTDQLKADVFLYGARKLIARVETFKTLPNTALAELFAHMNSRTYLPNEVVRRNREVLDAVFFISSGCVALYLNSLWELSHFNDGDEFGMINLFYSLKEKDDLSYVAVECSEIYMIKRRHLVAYFQQYPDVRKYFEERAKERATMITNRKMVLSNYGMDLFSQMRTGAILEEPRLRPFVIN